MAPGCSSPRLPNCPAPFDFWMPLPASPDRALYSRYAPGKIPFAGSDDKEYCREQPDETRCCCYGCQVCSYCGLQNGCCLRCCSTNRRATPGFRHNPFFQAVKTRGMKKLLSEVQPYHRVRDGRSSFALFPGVYRLSVIHRDMHAAFVAAAISLVADCRFSRARTPETRGTRQNLLFRYAIGQKMIESCCRRKNVGSPIGILCKDGVCFFFVPEQYELTKRRVDHAEYLFDRRVV